MRLKFILTFLILALIIVFFSSYNLAVFYTGGSPAGYTNSPYDNKTCTQCHVHVGTPHLRQGLINTDIPVCGFEGGNTYTVNLSVSSPGTNKFGFICSAHDNIGQNHGTFAITESNKTKIVGTTTKYVTHTSGGVNGSNNMQTWSFEWTAPQGITEVTFYAAFTAGSANNDSTFYTQHTVYASNTDVNEISTNNTYTIYPNPLKDILYITSNSTNLLTPTHYLVYTLDGKLVADNKTSEESIDLSFLSNGAYLIKLKSDRFSTTHKFYKQD